MDGSAADAVRNVAVLGPAGAGKSTLVAALCGRAAVPGRPGALRLSVTNHRGARVALLDTPGEPQLELARTAALRGAEAALLVLPALGGLDAFTVELWQRCEGRARAVVLTHLDSPDADVDEALALCRRMLGEQVVALDLPVHDDDGRVAGVLDLLRLRLSVGAGTARRERAAEPAHVALVENLRQDLLEAVVTGSEDDALLAGYLDGQRYEPGDVGWALHRAVRTAQLDPLLVTAPRQGLGLVQLLDLVVEGLPAPGDVAGPVDPAGPAVAEVLQAGRPALVRVWAGRWAELPPAAVGELAAPPNTPTGAVLSAPGEQPSLAGWGLPSPYCPARLAPRDPAGEQALAALLRGDPTLRHEAGSDLLWTLGPAHLAASLAGTPLRTVPLMGTQAVELRRIEVRLPATAARPLLRALAEQGIAGWQLGPADWTSGQDHPDDRLGASDADAAVHGELTLSQLAGLAPLLAELAHGAAACATVRLGRLPRGPGSPQP